MCTEQFRHIELQNYKNEEEENESESNETAFMITHTHTHEKILQMYLTNKKFHLHAFFRKSSQNFKFFFGMEN